MILGKKQLPGLVLLLLLFINGIAAFAFIPLYLKQNGFSLSFILLLYTLGSALTLFAIPLFKYIDIKKFLIFGFIGDMIILLTFSLAKPIIAYWILIILWSTFPILLWVPINYLFFIETQKIKKNATFSTLYSAIPPLLNLFIPLLAAYSIFTLGFKIHFLIIGFFSIVPILYVLKYVPDYRLKTSFKESFKSFKSLRIITAIDGAFHFLSFIIIPIYALIFFKSELELGGFFSYLGLISVIIAFIISSKSDKKEKRLKYIIPLFILYTVSILLIAVPNSITALLIVVGLYVLIDNISIPMRLTILLDTKKTTIDFWIAREFFLNVGRVVTLFISLIFFYFELYWAVFVFYSLLAILYLIIIKFKLKHIR